MKKLLLNIELNIEIKNAVHNKEIKTVSFFGMLLLEKSTLNYIL
jgi:hypothetical protein